MKKPLLFVIALAGAWYAWSQHTGVQGAYDENGEPVTLLFTTGQCGDACDQMRAYLKKRVEFEEFDAFEDEAGRALYLEYGGDGYLPYVVMGEQRVIGPDTGAVVSAMAAELGPGSIREREAQALALNFDEAGEPIVVMYATDWCGYCKQARDYFRANNIAFVEYDIEKNSKAKRNYDVLKGSGTPLIYQGYTRVVGFHPRLVEEKLNL